MAKDMLAENLAGKVAVVTGATGGIGKEIARGLARMGARVILAVRDPKRGEEARAEITTGTGSKGVSVLALDVSKLASVRGFADAVKAQHERVDLLVNNAGAWFTDRREAENGLELTFATNVLGPYLLTRLLLDRLRAAPSARILNVVSALAGNYDAEDLQFARRPWDGFKAYAQSKQALRMLTWGLATRLAGTGVTANAVSPGFVKTDLNRAAHGLVPTLINISAALFADSPAKGADTPLWAAVAPELSKVSGKYFEKRKEKDGKFRDAAAIADLEKRCEALAAARR